MKNKLLIYDDNCPLCNWYSALFIKFHFLPADGRVPFSTLQPGTLSRINLDKSRNEIPLLDTDTGEVLYGIDALLEILNVKLPFVQRIGRLRPINWLLRKAYKLVSYNRKIIVAKKCGAGLIDCTPDTNYYYRALLMVIFLFISTLMLVPLHYMLSTRTGFYHATLLELEAAHFTLFFINCLLALSLHKVKIAEYIGQVSVLSFIGILLLVPLLLVANWLRLPDWLITGYLGGVAVLVFEEYLRRMEYAGILPTNRWIAATNIVCMIGFLLFLFT